MYASARVEFTKLRRRPAVWVIGAIWLTLGVVFGYVIPYLLFRSKVNGAQLAVVLPASVIENAIQGFPYFGLALALILGVLITASEYGWGTVGTILVQRPSRYGLLLGKLVATGLILGVFVVALLSINAMSALGIAALEGAPSNWPSFGEVAGGAAAGWLILAVGAALGAMLGIALRATGIAIGVGLVYVSVIEALIGGFAGQSELIHNVATILPGINAGSLASGFGPNISEAGTPGMFEVVSPEQGAIALATYVLAFVALAMAIFGKRDVTA